MNFFGGPYAPERIRPAAGDAGIHIGGVVLSGVPAGAEKDGFQVLNMLDIVFVISSKCVACLVSGAQIDCRGFNNLRVTTGSILCYGRQRGTAVEKDLSANSDNVTTILVL